MDFASGTPAQKWVGEDPTLSSDEKALYRFSLAGKRAAITGGARGLGLSRTCCNVNSFAGYQ
ncbi:hypothetical protein LIPSTDRAFT_4212 [Lipomyces starkeyi NRRL Y-11557]|uniref:Uncharacterized protein n=1 Tax=Lipomyces starkeyi NRRL Y-11557 TaxID=675824 RepID=A0A1E3Q2A3_LIPST|nr:hypothetical protein LIPSTDRAFT_4212 [Lipomyces starkeyi NRRL Y-11557]